MLIKYIEPDERAGREARIADELALRLIDAGRAVEIKALTLPEAPAPAPAPAAGTAAAKTAKAKK